ncbi:MAG: hypothetical protein J5662_03725, partial [Clostridia bacterium]|nr:hypothetical protein [Clostridia bacterium]
MKKVICALLILTLVLSLLVGCDAADELQKTKSEAADFGVLLSEDEGNTEFTELKFESEEEMLASMKLASSNEKYELYYFSDNMAVALKEKATGKIMLSNPYNAALDLNYSGAIGQKLASQVVISYLEAETNIVDIYSSTECAEKGQYSIKTYDNGLSFELVFGTDNSETGAFLKVLSKDTYRDISEKVSADSKDILEIYYTLYKKSDLDFSGVYDVYPDMKAQDVYLCDLEISERDEIKLSSIFKEAG